ncbi:hypothetical protein D3C71_621750 [compost metagenome]
MKKQTTTPKTWNILLWIAQILLSGSLLWSGSMKLFQAIEELKAMWPWVGEVSPGFVKLTGVLDLIGAFGLVLPALLRFKPILIPLSAIGIILLMIAAGIFHISRGETEQIGVNIFFALFAGFIAWGRFKISSGKSKKIRL